MLKTNSKLARERVRAYIMENAADHLDDLGTPAADFQTVARAIWDAFTVETDGDRRRMNTQDRFIYWASGLAFGGLFLYYYRTPSALDILGTILDESEEEKARFSEDKAENLLSYLIFSEVYKATNR